MPDSHYFTPAADLELLDATDQPPHLITLADLAATLANTTKALIGPESSTARRPRRSWPWRGRCAARSWRVTRPASPFICPITPLRFPTELVDALAVVAQARLPLEVIANPVMGVTALDTITGSVALGHAEVAGHGRDGARRAARAVHPEGEHAERRRHAVSRWPPPRAGPRPG